MGTTACRKLQQYPFVLSLIISLILVDYDKLVFPNEHRFNISTYDAEFHNFTKVFTKVYKQLAMNLLRKILMMQPNPVILFCNPGKVLNVGNICLHIW